MNEIQDKIEDLLKQYQQSKSKLSKPFRKKILKNKKAASALTDYMRHYQSVNFDHFIYMLVYSPACSSKRRAAKFAKAIVYLAKNQILTPFHFNLIHQHKNPHQLAKALFKIDKLSIDPSTLKRMVSMVKKPYQLLKKWGKFHNKSYLRAKKVIANRHSSNQLDFLSRCLIPEEAAHCLNFMIDKDLDNKENRANLARHPSPMELYQAMLALDKNALLNNENFYFLKKNHYPLKLASLLMSLNENKVAITLTAKTILAGFINSNLLTNQIKTMLLSHPLLLTEFALKEVWLKIPEKYINASMVEAMITLTYAASPKQAIKEYMRFIKKPNLLKEEIQLLKEEVDELPSTIESQMLKSFLSEYPKPEYNFISPSLLYLFNTWFFITRVRKDILNEINTNDRSASINSFVDWFYEDICIGRELSDSDSRDSLIENSSENTLSLAVEQKPLSKYNSSSSLSVDSNPMCFFQAKSVNKSNAGNDVYANNCQLTN